MRTLDILRHRGVPTDLPPSPTRRAARGPDPAAFADRIAVKTLTPRRAALWLAAVKAGGLKPTARVVAEAIAGYGQMRGGAFARQDTIADRAGVGCRRTVARAVRALEGAGLVVREPHPVKGKGWRHAYWPCLPAEALGEHERARLRAGEVPLVRDAVRLLNDLAGRRAAYAARYRKGTQPAGADVTKTVIGNAFEAGADVTEMTIGTILADATDRDAKLLIEEDSPPPIVACRCDKSAHEEAKPQEALTSHAAAPSLTLGHAPPGAPSPRQEGAGAPEERPLSPRTRDTVAALAKVLQLAPALACRPLRSDALRVARRCDRRLAAQVEAAFAALDKNEPGAAQRAALAVVRPYQHWASQRNLLLDDCALGLVESRLAALTAFVRHERGASR